MITKFDINKFDIVRLTCINSTETSGDPDQMASEAI